MFVLKVNKSNIRILESEPIYGDSRNIYNVVLLFNEDWNGLTKVITFDNGEKSKPILVSDPTRTIVTTSIPWELLTYPGTIRISVAGAKDNRIVLPTQFCILGKVKQGSTTEYPPDVGNPPPSPTFAEQILGLIANKGDTIIYEDGVLRLMSGDKLLSETEIQNGSFAGSESPIPTLDNVLIDNKSFFEDDINQTYYLHGVTISYWKEDLEQSVSFADDIVQIVTTKDILKIYTISGEIITFFYSEDGTLMFGSRETSTTGADGKSAYEIAVDQGFVGTEQEWLDSLKGAKGKDGEDGESAYQIAVENGFEGTEKEWIQSLSGADGLNAYDIAVLNGYTGTEEEWLKSLAGSSAYQIAVENGYEGTEEEWLASLKGRPGSKGTKGDPGLTAYEIAVENGFQGTEEEWLASLKGEPGDQGDSAYQVAVKNGFEGTEEEWLESLKGSSEGGTPGTGNVYSPNIDKILVVSQDDYTNLTKKDSKTAYLILG